MLLRLASYISENDIFSNESGLARQQTRDPLVNYQIYRLTLCIESINLLVGCRCATVCVAPEVLERKQYEVC